MAHVLMFPGDQPQESSEATMHLSANAQNVARTGRDTTVAQWGVAAVVMVGSAASAGVGFAHLGEHWAVGVITGIGVDLALASGLIIGRRLRAVGITTTWGTVLTWLTGVMTLALNSGAAALEGRWVLAVAHAFLPVVLVVLCEAGSEAQLKLHHLARQAAATEQTRRDSARAAERAGYEAQQRERNERERQRANGVLVDAQDYARKAAELRGQATQDAAAATRLREQAERDRATAHDECQAAQRATQRLARVQQRTPAGSASSRDNKAVASREERREWVRQEHAAGRNPSGAEVDRRFGPPRTGAAIVAEVAAEQRAPLHAVGGGR